MLGWVRNSLRQLINRFTLELYAIVLIRAAHLDRAGFKMAVAMDTGSGTSGLKVLSNVKHVVTVLHLGDVSSSVILIMVATYVMCIRLAVREILTQITMLTKSRPPRLVAMFSLDGKCLKL